jgi:hypothetical protein
MSNGAEPVVHQMRVFLRGVSPMVWRRLLVRSDSTVADLHYTLQIAFGWSDSHLNCFRIHGKEFGVHQSGGPYFDEDPEKVHLADFGFRHREWFLYEYDFTAHWVHEIRVEQAFDLESKRNYPICLDGRRSAPPEDCGGRRAFLDGRREAPWRAHQLLQAIAESVRQQDTDALEDYIEDIPDHRKWLMLEQFDRRRANDRLRQYASGDRKWLFAQKLG